MPTPGVGAAVAAAVVSGCHLYGYKQCFDRLPATVYLVVNDTAGFLWYLLIAAVT